MMDLLQSPYLAGFMIGVLVGLWVNWFRLKPRIDHFRTLSIVQRRLRVDLEKAIYRGFPHRAWEIIESAHKTEDCTDLPCFICEVGDLSPTPKSTSPRNR